jgi:hypothetical protein
LWGNETPGAWLRAGSGAGGEGLGDRGRLDPKPGMELCHAAALDFECVGAASECQLAAHGALVEALGERVDVDAATAWQGGGRTMGGSNTLMNQ